jgi:glycosyltransferase involved in cell wall biosynthesis
MVAETRLAPALYGKDRIITISQSSKEEIVRELRFADGNVSVVAPGVDKLFSPTRGKSPTPLIVAVGRLVRSKRFDRVIKAAAKARRQVSDIQLIVVGSGSENSNLQDLVQESNYGNWIQFVGHVSDRELASIYSAAWLLVSASATEGWGMTVTEAARCGTPAAVTQSVGLCDSVIAGVTGVVVPEEELSKSIVELMFDHDRRNRLSDSARERALSLTWDRTSYQVLNLLLDTCPPPAG